MAAGLAAATMALAQSLPQGERSGGPAEDAPRAVTQAGFAAAPARMTNPTATPPLPVADRGASVLADRRELRVGALIDPARLHRVTRPGLYGVGQSPQGSSYGVIGGRLIRYDPKSLRIQSIIREIEAVLD